MLLQTRDVVAGCILTPPVRVVNHPGERAPMPDRHLQGGQSQAGVKAPVDGVTDHFPSNTCPGLPPDKQTRDEPQYR